MSEIVSVYCDGGCIGKNPSEKGGTWAFCFVDAQGQRLREESGVIEAGRWGLSAITNNVSEMVALLKAVYALPQGWEGTVYSDSAITLGRYFQGWKCEGLPAELIKGIRASRLRLGKTVGWRLLDGHPTQAQLSAGVGKRGNLVSEHNVWCDLACFQAGKAYLEQQFTMQEPVEESLFEEPILSGAWQ